MITVSPEKCTGCGTCVKVCPHGVWVLKDQKAYLAFMDRCIECGACMLNCHDGAINVTKGTGCLVAIIREDILKVSPKPGEEGCC